MKTATMVKALGSEYDATRAVALRTRIGGMAGVDLVDFNYTNNRVTVRYDPDLLSQKDLEDLVAREKRHRTRSVMELQKE